MDLVRLAIVGLGNMGSAHASHIAAGKIAHCELGPVYDVDASRMKDFDPKLCFTDPEGLFGSGLVDAVVIATPHFVAHAPLGIAASAHGRHVLVEKPIAVHKADALRLLAAITRGTPLLAPAEEGLHSVDLATTA